MGSKRGRLDKKNGKNGQKNFGQKYLPFFKKYGILLNNISK